MNFTRKLTSGSRKFPVNKQMFKVKEKADMITTEMDEFYQQAELPLIEMDEFLAAGRLR